MTPRTIKVFVYPELFPAYAKNQVSVVLRVVRGTVDINRVHSAIGFKGDFWVIAEHGQVHGRNIFQRSDGTAVLKTYTGEVVDVITPFRSGEGESVSAEDMPKWAARYIYEVADVSKPVLLDHIDEDLIYNMGVREHKIDASLKNFTWGNVQTPGKDMKEAFRRLWDITYNKKGDCGFESGQYVTIYRIEKKNISKK